MDHSHVLITTIFYLHYKLMYFQLHATELCLIHFIYNPQVVLQGYQPILELELETLFWIVWTVLEVR